MMKSEMLKIVYDRILHHYRIDPYPAQTYIESYYNDDRFYAEHSPDDWLKKEIAEYSTGLWRSYFNYLSDILEIEKGQTILDYGCGCGMLLSHFYGKGAAVRGIEPSKVARQAAKKIMTGNILYQNEEELTYHFPHQFDVVILHLVLEHVAYPGQFLENVLNFLNPGGKILVVVPNDINPLQARLGYTGFVSSVHLNYFTPPTLMQLLESAGLNVIFRGATFPMELFPLFGFNYFDNDAMGGKCHLLKLHWEKLLGPNIFWVYKWMFERWSIGRELIFIGRTDDES